MSTKLYCSNCGADLPEDAVFCHKCGVRVLVPNQPMTTRSKMTASENLEPSLNMSFQQYDEDDISLTTILKDLEAITADPSAPTTLSYTHDNPFGTTTTYQESGIPQTTPMYNTNQYVNQEPVIPAQPQNMQQTGQQDLLRDYFPTDNNQIPATNDDDPWPWELPTFTNTDQNAFSPVGNGSTNSQPLPQNAPQMPYNAPETPQPPLPPVNRYSSYQQEEPEDTNAPSNEPEDTTPSSVPGRRRNVKKAAPVSGKSGLFATLSNAALNTSKNKYYTYDENEDEDFEDEYAEPRRWPFVLLAILLVCVIITAGLYFFMPSALNKGIDAFNSVAHTHIKHINTEDPTEEESTTITVSTAPATTAPETTPTPEATPEPTPEPEIVSDEAYLDEVTTHFIRFYREYLDCMNNDNVGSLTHVSDALKAELQERFNAQNKDYHFQNNELYIDAPTYFVYSTTTDGEYDVAFTCQAFNYTTKRADGEEITSNPIMEVVMRYNPDTDEWTVTKMDINNSLELDQNNLLQIVE